MKYIMKRITSSTNSVFYRYYVITDNNDGWFLLYKEDDKWVFDLNIMGVCNTECLGPYDSFRKARKAALDYFSNFSFSK